MWVNYEEKILNTERWLGGVGEKEEWGKVARRKYIVSFHHIKK
jgi:hypothetical protein